MTAFAAPQTRTIEPDSTESSAVSTIDRTLDRRRRASLLTRVVEAEILPRLARVHVVGQTTATAPVTTKEDTVELVRLLLGGEADAPVAFMHLLRQRGATVSTLYLGVIPDAARMLGDLWDEDRCDFTQVTISMGRLQQIVRRLSPDFQIAAVSHAQPETVLLLPAPGDTHTMGLVILSEFFHREGWHVAGGPATTAEDGTAIARDTWVDVAGFSIGAASRIDALRKIIRTLRGVSRNRDLGVMVGGPLLRHQPDLVARVGADMGAQDAQTAVRQASGLLSLRTAAD
jgi:methanogenic corrinoid protein MtbC1